METGIGIEVHELRKASDLESSELNAIVMPGGESTTMRLTGNDAISSLLPAVFEWIRADQMRPVLGTCAGAILMGKCKDKTFEKMDFRINRNYYGRQTDSFEEYIKTTDNKKIKGVFIRAPGITSIGNGVKPIAWKGDEIVGCTENKHMALTFHPELTNDVTFHELWIKGLK